MERIETFFKMICKLVLMLLAIMAAAEAVSLGRGHHKNRYLVEVNLDEDE